MVGEYATLDAALARVAELEGELRARDAEVAMLRELIAQRTGAGAPSSGPKVVSEVQIDPLASPAVQQVRLDSSLATPPVSVPERSERRRIGHSTQASIVSVTSSTYGESPLAHETSNEPLTLDLSDSQSDFIALGSSPRKATPVRMKFASGDLELIGPALSNVPPKASVTDHTVPEDTLDTLLALDSPSPDKTPQVGSDDFHFDQLVTPRVEPLYRQLAGSKTETDPKSPTHRMLLRTPSENTDTVTFSLQNANPLLSAGQAVQRPLTPPQLHVPAEKPPQTPNVDSNYASDATGSLEPAQSADIASLGNSQGSMENAQHYSRKAVGTTKPLLDEPFRGGTGAVAAQAAAAVAATAAITPMAPPRATAVPPMLITPPPPPPRQNISVPNTPKVEGLSDDTHNFLINSLQYTSIHVETIVDPISLSDPKVSSYWIMFKVFSNEHSALTPMYRIRRSYADFLTMDKTLRPAMPFLQQPPEMASMRRLNYRLWEQNKLIVDSYVEQALGYLRRGMPNTDTALRAFTTYFEFTLPGHDEPESLLDLSSRWDYLLYAKQKFPNKAFEVVQLIFSEEGDSLLLKSFSSKSETIARDDTIVACKGQEIVLKKKKKFAASKSWILYAQSHEDGEAIGKRLHDWLGAEDDEEEDIVDSVSQSSQPTTASSLPATNLSQPPSGVPAGSPSLAWSLFGKRQSKMPPGSPKSAHSNSPNKTDNVLAFKSQPYEGAMTSASSVNSMASPKRQNAPVFEPIDNTPKYFGTTLQGAFDLCPKYQLGGHNVPSVIFRCLNYLHANSAEGFEGIFRLNGMMSEVNAIEREFNASSDCALEDMSPKPDVYSVATLMKRYLRKVEGGIIIDDVAEEMYHVVKVEGDMGSQQLARLRNLLNELPLMNRNVLFVVFSYLIDVLKQGAHNKMGVSAMSVLIGPNITESRGTPIAVVLLNNFGTLFGPAQ